MYKETTMNNFNTLSTKVEAGRSWYDSIFHVQSNIAVIIQGLLFQRILFKTPEHTKYTFW
jgi:hypothetical protein